MFSDVKTVTGTYIGFTEKILHEQTSHDVVLQNIKDFPTYHYTASGISPPFFTIVKIYPA